MPTAIRIVLPTLASYLYARPRVLASTDRLKLTGKCTQTVSPSRWLGGFEMSWCTDTSQPATILDIRTSQGDLTVVLARRDEAETMSLYRRIQVEAGKQVLHIAAAAGRADVSYPIDAVVHACPMYHQGQLRSRGLEGFWRACQETARQGQAVLIHCNQSFHRGPLALVAIMVRAGYSKELALTTIVARRCIFLGHTVPFEEWPRAEREGTHAQKFLDCHAWIATLGPGAYEVFRDVDPCRELFEGSQSAASASGPPTAEARTQADAPELPQRPAAAVTDLVGSEAGWRCASCNKLEQNMRQCWECSRWDCRSCSFWCTTCPKGNTKYNICGHCNGAGIYLVRYGKVWRCQWCSQA